MTNNHNHYRWHGLTEQQAKEEITDIEDLKKLGFDYIDGGNSAGYILSKLRELEKLKQQNDKLRYFIKVHLPILAGDVLEEIKENEDG